MKPSTLISSSTSNSTPNLTSIVSTSLFLMVPLFIIIFILYSPAFSQDPPRSNSRDQQETVSEYVEVVNIQMVLRALRKGQPVGGLSKSDFTLYENGKPTPITSLTEVRRHVGLNSGKEPPAEETGTAGIPKPKRLFLLHFWLSEADPHVDEALDFFFNRVYREGDYVLLTLKNKVFTVTRGSQVPDALALVKTGIKEITLQAKLERDRLADRLETMFRDFEEEFRRNEDIANDQGALMNRIIAQYKSTWAEYKNKNITLNGNILKNIAASLKYLDFEKWGIVFYQHDTFPQWIPESIRARDPRTEKHLEELKREIRFTGREMARTYLAPGFIRDVQQAFIDANSTFHLMLSSIRTYGKLESIYLRHGNVHSDWKQAFRDISLATGGEVIDDNVLKLSLGKVVEKEDIYYRLTFSPGPGKSRVRDIKIKSGDKTLKLFYHRKARFSQVGEVTIENVSFTHPDLEFTLRNYRQFFDGTRLHGDLDLKITGVDSKGEMSTSERILQPDSDATTVAMKLNFPGSGDYSLILEALDRQSGKSTVFSQKINIPPAVSLSNEPVLISELPKAGTGIRGDVPLETILERTARYCRELKKITFYFVCSEEVTDSYFIRGEQVKEDRYLYDYQIIMEENGYMNESRELKFADNTGGPGKTSGKKKRKKKKSKKKKKKPNDESDSLVVTNFFSKYPFLLPVTILARENQNKHRYRLLARESIMDRETRINRDTYKLAVELKQRSGPPAHYAVVWVDAADGSVVKIQLDPHFVKGIETLKKVARQKQKNLKITDIHWYDVKRGGVRFPSRTEINGLFLARSDGGEELQNADVSEQVRTVFAYKKYLFFRVNSEVLDSGHDD
ncbi:MAG: hypothetical protein GY940_07420 [bacterium]|nr:hypothetical protein [bacterium]